METLPKFMTRELAESLLAKYDSPLFVYDAKMIESRAQELVRAASDFHISYAMKANSNKEILKIIAQNGIHAVDVVSPGEIYKALQNKYSPNQIIYTQNFISEKQMDYALKSGVTLNIGALETLDHFKEKLSGKQIFIRVNPELGAGENYNVITGGPKSKFGIYGNELDIASSLAEQWNIKIVGLHQHIGSNLKKGDKEVFLQTTKYIFKLIQKFPSVTKINIGGGIGVKYRPTQELLDIKQLYSEVRSIRDEYAKDFGRDIQVCIEPGRFLVAESGYLLCKITATKKTPEKKFIGTDTGFNHLLRPALYGSFHNIVNLIQRDSPTEKTVICGNICECTDNLGTDIEINGEIGDILCIENAGAYAFSMSSNYNQRLKPAQVLMKNGVDTLIRRRETFEDLIEKL